MCTSCKEILKDLKIYCLAEDFPDFLSPSHKEHEFTVSLLGEGAKISCRIIHVPPLLLWLADTGIFYNLIFISVPIVYQIAENYFIIHLSLQNKHYNIL